MSEREESDVASVGGDETLDEEFGTGDCGGEVDENSFGSEKRREKKNAPQATTFAFVNSTPFGAPVLPLVYMINPTSSGSGKFSSCGCSFPIC